MLLTARVWIMLSASSGAAASVESNYGQEYGVNIEHEIAGFIRGDFARQLEGRTLAPDLELLDEGILDSMGVMEIVMFIEQTFDVTIEDDDIVPANFGSVRALAHLVSTKQAASSLAGDAGS